MDRPSSGKEIARVPTDLEPAVFDDRPDGRQSGIDWRPGTNGCTHISRSTTGADTERIPT
jgi:hypothetical protein